MSMPTNGLSWLRPIGAELIREVVRTSKVLVLQPLLPDKKDRLAFELDHIESMQRLCKYIAELEDHGKEKRRRAAKRRAGE